MSNLVIEYSEQQKKNAQQLVLHPAVQESFDDPEAFIITFSEEPEDSDQGEMLEEVSSYFEDDGDGEEDHANVDEDELLMNEGDRDAMSFDLPGRSSFSKIPGAVDYVDDEDEEEEEPEEPKQTDWENDRDVRHFMPYILKQYPGGIPRHDGHSTLGCERAILFLTKLNKEISEALRSDPDERDEVNDDSTPASGQPLDITALENIRVNMIRDIVKLKERVKELNKKHKRVKKKGEDESEEIVKEATVARSQLVVSAFERAITGIIINAVVSGGKPLEDVYDFLKKKYAFTEREELSLQQLLMDMGQPIFKDRGTIGESDHDDKGHGLDFIKNYFA